MIDNLQDAVKMVVELSATRDAFTIPNRNEAVMFIVTEVGELFDAILREDDRWVRNSQREQKFEKELADVVFMCLLAAIASKIDIDKVVREQLVKRTIKHAPELEHDVRYILGVK